MEQVRITLFGKLEWELETLRQQLGHFLLPGTPTSWCNKVPGLRSSLDMTQEQKDRNPAGLTDGASQSVGADQNQ